VKATTPALAAPALVLSLVLLLPFLGKAFTVDDTVFMRAAQHALVDPLHPTAFDYVWRQSPERVSQHVPTGPVMPWLLVPAAAAGGDERVAHAIQLAMLSIGVLATVSLARRLGLAPGWCAAAGVLVVAMPAVLGMAGTAMPDVPAMALGVAGMERLAAWAEERRPSQGSAAAVLLALAGLTRSHALLLLPIGAAWVLGFGRDRPARGPRWSRYLPLAAAAVLVGLLTLATRDPAHGSGGMLRAASFYSSFALDRLAGNAVAAPIHWALTMGLVLPMLCLRGGALARSRTAWAVLVGGVLLSAACLACVRRSSLALPLAAGLGVLVLWDVLAQAVARRDAIQLALGLWLLLPLAALPYVHLPPKLLVVCAPAAALLVARELARTEGRMAWLVLSGTVAAGAALGVAIVRADAAMAEVGRRAAAELIAPRVAAGQRVWFIGHWGFQWYAEEAGGRHATITPPHPEPGDHLVVSAATARAEDALDMMRQLFPGMVPVEQVTDETPGGRIMNKRLNAGFYSNVSGYWPWVWGDGPVDVVVGFDL